MTDKPENTSVFSIKRYVFIFVVAVSLALLDRWIKQMVVVGFSLGESRPLIDGWLQLTYVENTGAAFGMFQESPIMLTIISTVLLTLVFVYLFKTGIGNRWQMASITMVLGGALGNIYDRIFLGKVIDYIDVVIIHYPVFNLADSLIVIGVSLYIAQTFFLPDKEAS